MLIIVFSECFKAKVMRLKTASSGQILRGRYRWYCIVVNVHLWVELNFPENRKKSITNKQLTYQSLMYMCIQLV